MNSQDSVHKHMPYEGAGFLLTYSNYYILGISIKSISEIEYIGGKPEFEDDNDPFQTAFAELVEEVGMNPLEDDWKHRLTPMYLFNGFSDKWIRCENIDLTDLEYSRLLIADRNLSQWDVDTLRYFTNQTGRAAPVRKAIRGLVKVDKKALMEYVLNFSRFPQSKNRCKDAREYQAIATSLFGTRLSTLDVEQYQLRPFNTVLFEDYIINCNLEK